MNMKNKDTYCSPSELLFITSLYYVDELSLHYIIDTCDSVFNFESICVHLNAAHDFNKIKLPYVEREIVSREVRIKLDYHDPLIFGALP